MLVHPLLSLLRSSRPLAVSLGLLLAVGWCWAFFSLTVGRDRVLCHTGTPQERRLCYRDYYKEITTKDGARVALADLEKRQADGALWNQCHELTHAIGETMGKSERTLPKIFAEGSAFCRAGYYHGVLAEVVKQYGNVPPPKTLTTLCTGLPGEGTGVGLYRHCTHGVGHGLMFATRGDVLASLEHCDAFSSNADRKECAGGVYMEHFMADGVEHVSKEAGIPTPGLCEKSPPLYMDVCYERAGTQFGSDNAQSPEKSFALCLSLSATPAQKSTCIEGIGLIALGERDLSPSDPSLYCAHGKDRDIREICYRGAMNTLGKVAPELGDPKTVVCARVANPLYKEECLSVFSH